MNIIKDFFIEEKGGIAENAGIIVLMLIIVVGAVSYIGTKVKATTSDGIGKQLDSAKGYTY